MRPFGLMLIVMSVVVPLFPFLSLAQMHPNMPIIGQYFGVAALIVMAIGQLLATRLSILEWVFGPLDKSYVLHKWLGIIAVVTMLMHNTIGAEIKNLKPKTALADFGEGLGEFGMNGILVLVGLSLALFVPYHLWRLTHKAIGGFFVLSALHFMLISKPFALGDPIGLYVMSFCTLGVVSYGVTLLPMRLRRGFAYEVTEVSQTGEAVAIKLTSLGKPMRHRAGQFAFFRFEQNGLTEPHPFTVSSAPQDDGSLRVSVKALGGSTQKLGAALKSGSAVTVQGPYGRFGASQGKTPQIWVAAGIGITPFMALLDTVKANQAPIDVFYTFRGMHNAPHRKELADHCAKLTNVTLHQYDTESSGRLTAADIVSATTVPLNKAKVLFCGPTALRNDLANGLKKYGVPKRRFQYEVFEIRSDIWPLDRINVPVKAWIAKFGF